MFERLLLVTLLNHSRASPGHNPGASHPDWLGPPLPRRNNPYQPTPHMSTTPHRLHSYLSASPPPPKTTTVSPPGVLRPVLTLSSSPGVSPGALCLLSGCGVRVFLGVSVRRRPHPKFHFFFSSSSFSAGASRLSSLSPFHCCPTEAGRGNGGKKKKN